MSSLRENILEDITVSAKTCMVVLIARIFDIE